MSSSSSSPTRVKSTLAPTQKSVRFPAPTADNDDESNNDPLPSQISYIESRSDWTDDDKKLLWFARNEYHVSRSTARVISQESERYGYSQNLDHVYDDVAVVSDNEDIQDRLNLWALHGHSRRGLERWANAVHGQARKEDSIRYIQGVIHAQHEMRTKNRRRDEGEAATTEAGKQDENADTSADKDTDTSVLDHERLRQVGHVLSRKSRLFAQMMGAADEYAAQCEFGMTGVGAAGVTCNINRTSLAPTFAVGRTSFTSPRHRVRKKRQQQHLGLLSGSTSSSTSPCTGESGHPSQNHHHSHHHYVSTISLLSPTTASFGAPPLHHPLQQQQRVNQVSVSDLSLQRLSFHQAGAAAASEANSQGSPSSLSPSSSSQLMLPMVMIPPSQRRSSFSGPQPEGRVPRMA
jgi:hypothetical protein